MAKKLFIALIFLILFSSIATAEITFNKQPEEIYNIGDSFTVPVGISSSEDVFGTFYMELVCEGESINFYSNGLSLSQGQEKTLESTIVFQREIIGELKGNCKIKATFLDEQKSSEIFKLSDSIFLSPEFSKSSFDPGEEILIEGSAIKENEEPVEGFLNIEVSVKNGSENMIKKQAEISKGFYSDRIILPNKIEAKKYLLKLNAYELNSNEEKTNTGVKYKTIEVNQIPTFLEIVSPLEINPNSNLEIKPILRDQTGKPIDSTAEIKIVDNNGKKRAETKVSTGEVFNYKISYSEMPSKWKIFSESEGLENEKEFIIKEMKDINLSFINNTLIVKNVGNIFYNGSISVKIGNESIEINISLGVNETREYLLNAPDGNYNIKAVDSEGDNFTHSAFLTGNSVSVTEKRNNLFRYWFTWIFVVLVFGFVAYLFFKKGNKATFFGYMPKKKKKHPIKTPEKSTLEESSKLHSRNKAILSLSIKGEKQKSSVVCLNVKNLEEVTSKKTPSSENLQKIINYAEDNNAVIYKNQNALFFILTPLKTKTFDNEKIALDLAKNIKKTILNQNKLFKQKINFGISINSGEIIAKTKNGRVEFMSFGDFIPFAKKMSSRSQGEILMSRNISEKLRNKLKTEKLDENIYSIKEIKSYDVGRTKKFIEDFSKRYDRKYK